MKNFIKKFIQNICAFLLFLFLISILFTRLSNFIKTHQHSVLHELDDTLLDQLHNIHSELDTVKHKFEADFSPKEKEIFNVLKEKTKKLENDYTKNSHGLFILGPIGTIAMVMKEQRIKHKLLEIVVTLFDLVRKYASYAVDLTEKPINSIEEGLELIQKISS